MKTSIVRDKDGQLRLRVTQQGREEYQHKRYLEHQEEIRANYNSQTQYLKWVDVKKTINALKKQIGTVNYDLVMGEIEKLERSKYG